MSPSLLQRLASAQLAIAAVIAPKSHREWLQDMRVEAAYIESDSVALRWAMGCVIASVMWRTEAMSTLNNRISRPVLVLEWLMCFGPLTLAWVWSLLYVTRGLPADLAAEIYVGMAFAALGPIALVVALLTNTSKRSQAITRTARALVLAMGAMCLLQLLDMGAAGRLDLLWFRFDLGTFVLLSLLPLLGCLHVAYLSGALQRPMPSVA